MEGGQETTDQKKGINNSVRGASLCLGLKPETVSRFLPLMRSFETKDTSGLNYEEMCEENRNMAFRLKEADGMIELLLLRIEELANTVTNQHAEIVKLQQDVKKAQGKVA